MNSSKAGNGDARIWLERSPNQPVVNKALVDDAVHQQGILVHSQPGLLDVEQAADYIAMSRVWLHRNYRLLPHVRIGNGKRPCIRFRRADLDQWIARHRVTPAGME